MIFTHHGDYGDVVYQLIGVKHLCDEAGGRCTFYLSPANDTRERMTAEHAEGLLPLLRAQPYVARAEWHPTGSASASTSGSGGSGGTGSTSPTR
jgi:hypothetical protein